VPQDASRLLELFGELADYEKIRDQLVASEEQIRESLFGEHPAAAALIAERLEAIAAHLRGDVGCRDPLIPRAAATPVHGITSQKPHMCPHR